MSVNLEIAINNMVRLKNKGIRYSMNGSRTGADGTGDCSGTIYDSLRKGGASDGGWVLNTDSMHPWLEKNGFELIAENTEWNAKRGDVVIFGGKRDRNGVISGSGGFGGHVVLFMNNTTIIHCTYKSATANGVYIDNESTTCPYNMGWFTYRQKSYENKINNDSVDNLAREVIKGKYGSGDERKAKLGLKYDEVQKRVNEILNNKKPNINIVADDVIKGKYGDGDERKRNIEKLGLNFNEVQKIVNQKLK